MNSIHGGDIYRNHVELDFSVNVNPLGIPEAVKQALHDAVERCMTYPDIEAEKLQAAAAGMLSVPEECLLFGNGASELFMAAVHALRPEKIVIPVPSFYGYEHAASAVSDQIVCYPMKKEHDFYLDEGIFDVLDSETDMLFLANPNNPTGALLDKTFLRRLFAHCRENQILVILDECFIEFCGEECSVLSELAEWDNVILVRAFTKLFTIPGVRLGYLICTNAKIRDRIRRQLPEWNLSVFAQEAGAACTKQKDFIKKTRDYIKTERQFLEEGLKNMDGISCQVFPGTANFILLQSEKPLYERLLKRGILIRNCENFKGLGRGFYRIAVKTRPENERLLKVMGEINWNESSICCQMK